MSFRSGFVTIVGRPNAGKSTLLNALVGEKIAIVSDKPQTTRLRLQGILNLKPQKGRLGAQIVFIDTPGVHRPDSRLNRKMMQEVHEALQGCDLLLLLVDASEKFGSGDQKVLELVAGLSANQTGTETSGSKPALPVFLLLNKIDKIPKEKLLPLIEHYRGLHDFREIIPISAIKRDGLDPLLGKVVSSLPQGPRYFPEDQLTDQPERFLAAEIIREKALQKTRQEVPHSVAVLIEQFEELEKLTRIAATLYCERDGQKAILIGKKGDMLKQIGTAARVELEHLLDKKIFLELFVKVKPDWRESPAFVDEMDWRS